MNKNLLGNDHNILTAMSYLSNADNIMAQLIIKHGYCQLTTTRKDPFQTLVTSIISQQLSSSASEKIELRLKEKVIIITPDNLLNQSISSLKETGLSSAKSKYILDIASRFKDNSLNITKLYGMSNDEVIAELIQISGIGKWTAEMFLIFGLKRLDVLSSTDTGLKRSVKKLYGEKSQLEIISNNWKPYRSIGSWYLWKELDDG